MDNSMQGYARYCALAILTMIAAGCQPVPDQSSKRVDGRWFTVAQVTSGEQIFQQNCQLCHGEKAVGTDNWRVRLPDGKLPPPPLNGSAHTWHHSRDVLLRVISHGGVPLGGSMPPFKDVLNESEMLSVIAYLQSLWSDEIYQAWMARNG